MRGFGFWSSFGIALSLAGCGSPSGDDLYNGSGDHFGNVTKGGSDAGGTVSFGGTGSAGTAAGGASSGGALSTGGSGTGGGVAATGGSGSAGSGGASGGLSSGGSSPGGAATKGGAGGVVGKGGASSGGSSGKTCEQMLAALPELLNAAQACTANASQTACNGFVKDQCGCMKAVNDTASAATKAYSDGVTSLLSGCGVACTGVVCATVTAAECVTSGSGSAGHCLGK